jgi:DNA-binding transcriptional LysR family regulator
MEMHQVRYFLSMARQLNFTRAADECNVTQPSLTRAVQKLEEELGGALFRRERSRTHLTDLGRLMLPHLERTYEAAQAAKELARSAGKAQVAPLALGIASIVDSDTLDAILAELVQGLPGFELKVVGGSSDELIELALSGTLDLLIVEAPEDAPERFEAWALYAHRYSVLASAAHPFAAAGSVTIADTRDEAWIDCGGAGRARLFAAARSAGFEPDVRHQANDAAHLRRLIASGLGIAFMPAPRPDTRISAVRLVDVAVERDVVLAAIAGRRRSIAADAFVRASRARAWEAAASA